MAYTNLNAAVSKIPDWLTQGISKDTIDFTEKFGQYLAKPPKESKGGALSTSQIRTAYGEITRLKMRFNLSEALMIKPKMAYAAKRANNETSSDLERVISAGIDAVANASIDQQEKVFNNLANLFEAILAYHKANGGK